MLCILSIAFCSDASNGIRVNLISNCFHGVLNVTSVSVNVNLAFPAHIFHNSILRMEVLCDH